MTTENGSHVSVKGKSQAWDANSRIIRKQNVDHHRVSPRAKQTRLLKAVHYQLEDFPQVRQRYRKVLPLTLRKNKSEQTEKMREEEELSRVQRVERGE